MDTTKRVQTLSRRLRIVFTVVLFLIPAIQIIFWIFFNQLPIPKDIISKGLPVVVQNDLPLSIRLMALAVSFISASVVMACVYRLIRLFRLYEKMEIFTEGAVKCVRSLGKLLIWLFFAKIIEDPLMSLALTMHNSPGHREIDFALSSDDIAFLLIGIVTVLIAWVMEEGRKLQEEQQFTI